jgi:hypothetical protein
MRKFRVFVLICLGGLIVAEGCLRLLPVSQGFYLDNITSEQPIARRVGNRIATSSSGWGMAKPVSVPINRQGYIHTRGWNTDEPKTVVVLIGDSQIEAPLIPWEQSLANGLERRLEGDMRVYPVGMSGAPLSQYLIWHRHMAAVYKPETILIFVSSNDYVESFDAYGLFPGFHYFVEDVTGTVSLKLRTYRRGMVGRVASSSSLVAYILNNLGGVKFLNSLRSAFKPVVAQQAKAQLAASASSASVVSHDDIANQARQEIGRKAIGLFFDRLPRNGRDQANIVFVMNPDTQGDVLSDAFRLSARTHDYPILELGQAFDQSVSTGGQALVFQGDVHWNKHGQAVVADVVASFLCMPCD